MLSVRYKSSVGAIIMIIFTSQIFLFGFMLYLKIWEGMVICFLIGSFIGYLVLNTYYVIRDKTLKIRSGFLVDLSIDILAIREIAETHDMRSAPASSLDRFEIFYNKTESILVSPKEKSIFLHQLVTINPAIIVLLKEKNTVG